MIDRNIVPRHEGLKVPEELKDDYRKSPDDAGKVTFDDIAELIKMYVKQKEAKGGKWKVIYYAVVITLFALFLGLLVISVYSIMGGV